MGDKATVTRAYVHVGNAGFADGPFAIYVTTISTRATTILPLPFPTREAAEDVINAICRNAPHLYTDAYPWDPV